MDPFNRHTFPQGGWLFYQPQTGWRNPAPMGLTFEQTVESIIRHRMKNPAITAKHKLATDYSTVSDELETFTRKRLGLPPPPVSDPKSSPRRGLPRSVADAVAGVERVANGGALLLEWESSGQPPVPSDVSEARASTCAMCPVNSKGDFTSFFTKPVSEMIRRRLERLHSMKLSTHSDSSLGVCTACECPLKLKVHTPLGLVKKHLSDRARADLWSQCWILLEPDPSA